MFAARTKKTISVLIVIFMLFSLASFLPGLTAAAANGASSDLSDFVTGVTIYDMSQNPPKEITNGDTTYIGNTYKFAITFAESTSLQMEYNAGVLTYQLPSSLEVQADVTMTPVYNATGIIVGWYSIDTSGLVTVRFYAIDNNGDATTDNYIDNYANVTVTLDIYAQLTAGSGGNLDFGNDITVEITPPSPLPPKLTMTKTSRYDATTERIYYMIRITASDAPVSNITLTDSPTVANSTDINNAPGIFYGFRYGINGNTRYTPMSVTWSDSPTSFSYNFGADNVTLQPGDYITVLYYLDIPLFIANNPSSSYSNMSYNFDVLNDALVSGDGVPDVPGHTDNPVQKVFPISKSGEYVAPNTDPGAPDSAFPYIKWTSTIGDGSTTPLNDGAITDTLGAGLTLPDAADINVTLYDNAGNSIFSGTAADLSSYFSSTSTGFTFTLPAADDTIPGSADAFGEIYQVVIVYYTQIPFPPVPGQPPVIYENSINFKGGGVDVGTGGRVPFTPPTAGIINKTTSGIICDIPSGYQVKYTITLNVPGGLLGAPFYLYDTLGMAGSGSVISNQPQGFTISATNTDGTTLLIPLICTTDSGDSNGSPTPVVTGNTWQIYFGTYTASSGNAFWQYSRPVTVTISYSVHLPDATIAALQVNSGAQLSNAAYLIYGTGEPILGGTGQNSVAGTNVNDSWPIFKSGAATDNPSLFNYTVTIKGGYSSRTDPLLQSGFEPIYTDTFDPAMEYVSGSFYVVDTGNPGTYYAPAQGSDVDYSGGNSFIAYFTTLQAYNGTYPNGTPTATTASDWFAVKRNLEVHYQLNITAKYLIEKDISGLQNTAQIQVDKNACIFNAIGSVNYTYTPLSKTLTPTSPGSDRVTAQIVINPDGSTMFSDGTNPAPATITAVDKLNNLMMYVDSVHIYTQTKSNGVWDGVWVEEPHTINTGDTPWSVNVVSSGEVDFVIPNGQPVKIVYDALVTLAPGTTGDISNSISIFGQSKDAGEDNYEVSGSNAGANASKVNLQVFKAADDPDNPWIPLQGAEFSLYVTTLPDYGAPSGYANADTLPVPATDGTSKNFYLLDSETSGADGIAAFDDQWLNTSYQLLFLLVEDKAPGGYAIDSDSQYTFFTISPYIPADTITGCEDMLGCQVNQVSDFITIGNAPVKPVTDATMKVLKRIGGLTDAQQQAYLSNFQLVITDPTGAQQSYTLKDALDGIEIDNLIVGTYFFAEKNCDVPGYSLTANPKMPFRYPVSISDNGQEISITIDNTYTYVPPAPPAPTPPTGSVPPTGPTTPTEPATPAGTTPTTEPTASTGPATTTEPTSPTDTTPTTEPTTSAATTSPTEPTSTTLPTGATSPSEPTTPQGPTGPTSPQTSDSHPISVFIVMLILSVVCLMGAAVYGLRKRILSHSRHRL